MITGYILIIYVIFVNLIGFVNMGRDKQRAKRNQWRIKENTLFLTAILGGSIGSIIGMYCFRHKTKHVKFILGMPLILIIQSGLLIFVIYKFTSY